MDWTFQKQRKKQCTRIRYLSSRERIKGLLKFVLLRNFTNETFSSIIFIFLHFHALSISCIICQKKYILEKLDEKGETVTSQKEKFSSLKFFSSRNPSMYLRKKAKKSRSFLQICEIEGAVAHWKTFNSNLV